MKFIASFFTIFLAALQLYSKPLIVAHRGASKRAPENTIEAFKLAYRKRADAVEIDIRLTKDNVIVCHHDRSTKRMTGKDFNIDEVNFNQIENLAVGHGFKRVFSDAKIPRLEKILTKVSKRRKLFIEIKTGQEILPHLKSLIDNSHVKNKNLTVISFNADVLKEFKILFPEIRTLLLINLKGSKYVENNLVNFDKILFDLKEINANGISCKGNSSVTADLVNKMHDHGYELHVWTIDAKENAVKFKNIGVNSITTNYPKRIRKAIR